MKDIALGAFSVFFTQSPSFLEHQKKMEKERGKSNAQTIFGIKRIPTDNHIRDILDPVSSEIIFPVYNDVFSLLNNRGHIDSFRVFNGDVLIAMDATWYFSSKSIHCENCSTKTHKEGPVTYSHCVINPVIVAPGRSEVIPLVPESSINEIADQFLDYLATIHYAKVKEIRQLLNDHGGYVGHFDGTCEVVTDILFTAIDEISGIVLLTTRMPTENVDDIKGFLDRCKKLSGVPLP